MLASMMAAATRRARRTPEPATNGFGDFLREVMDTHGCKSVADLVRLIGIDQSSVSRYLQGQSEPTMSNLRKIAASLDANLGDLMVAANICGREELFVNPTPQRRLAPVLRATQEFLDHDGSTDKAKQLLLKALRGLLDMAVEARDGVRHEPSHVQRQRKQ